MNVLSKPNKQADRIVVESTARDSLLAAVSQLQPGEACAKLASGLEGLSDDRGRRAPEEIRTQPRRARTQGHDSGRAVEPRAQPAERPAADAWRPSPISWATSAPPSSSPSWWCWRSPPPSSRSTAPTRPPPGCAPWCTPPRASGAGPVDADDPFSEIPIEQLVPGDIVRLSAGDMIPADLRLLAAKDLFVNQAALTGEVDAGGEIRPGRAPATRKTPFELPNLCFMGTNVVTRLRHRRGPADRRRQPTSASSRDEIAGRRVPTSFRQGHQQVHLADDPLHAGDGAGGVPDQRPDQAQLAGGVPVRGGGGRRPDARNAADDRDGQPGQGRDRHVAQEGDRQAPERHPELRRDGRAVHRQDRHAHAGQDRPEAAPGRPAATNPSGCCSTPI